MEDKHSAPVEGWETLTEIIEAGREDELVSIIETSFQIHQPNLKEAYKAVSDALKHQYGEEFEAAFFSFMLGEQREVEIPSDVIEFLENLARDYREPLMAGYMRLFEPHEWRHVTSSARYNDRGARLETDILRWDGEKTTITGDIPNVVNFVEHFIRNLNTNFSEGSLQQSKQATKHYIKKLKREIEELEETLET